MTLVAAVVPVASHDFFVSFSGSFLGVRGDELLIEIKELREVSGGQSRSGLLVG